MIAEAAICLALDADLLPKSYGFLTPAAAMGPVLRERLQRTGMEFYIEKDNKA